MALHWIDKMAVEDEGEGDAVVCVHGLGGSSNTWVPLMSALAGQSAGRSSSGAMRSRVYSSSSAKGRAMRIAPWIQGDPKCR